MKFFIEKINQNQRNLHFILYCFTFLIYGAYINCLGPLIPYLSKQYGRKETDYSTFFTIRTISYVLGAFFIRFTINKFKYHSIIIVANIILFFGSFFFISDSFTSQSISVFIVNGMFSILDPILNVLLLIFNSDPDKQFWILIGHSVFGLGCLIAPILVYYTELNSFNILGIINVFSVIGYWKLQTPKSKQGDQKDIRLSEQTQLGEKLHTSTHKSQKINNKALFLLAFLFFIYIGEEVTFGGWISSYSVLTGFANEQQATMLSSLYYIFVTLFRIMFILIPPSKNSSQIQKLLTYKIITSVLLVFIQQSSPEWACYIGCLCYGYTMSSLYAKFLSIPNQFNIYLTGENFASIIIVGSIGEAALASVTGSLMNYTPYVFYWCMLFMSVVQIFVAMFLINLFRKQSKQREKYDIEMNQLKK